MSQLTWISKLLSDCVLNRTQSVPLTPALFLILAGVLAFSGCCTTPTHISPAVLYKATPPQQATHNASPPAFYVKSAEKPYNKIGTPVVTEKKDYPLVKVSSASPTIYFDENVFTTLRSTYTNHIYRIHFPEVPFGWCNFNITAGKNPGLLIIYTFNPTDKLVLITTVHTCGCYLAFFPTEDLAKESYPPNWPQKTQSVYGYTLPSIIPSPLPTANQPYYFTLESGTHRISDISHIAKIGDGGVLAPAMTMEPMEKLYHLPYEDESISFFESSGRRAGYVKNNSKILERMLISWWAFDWHVGEDKAYGTHDESTTPFYTSLKFWQRTNSDMKDFSRFLSYWGWTL